MLLLLLPLSHFSHVQRLTTPWTAAYSASLSVGFSRQEYWSGVPLPSPITLIVPKQSAWNLGGNSINACWFNVIEMRFVLQSVLCLLIYDHNIYCLLNLRVKAYHLNFFKCPRYVWFYRWNRVPALLLFQPRIRLYLDLSVFKSMFVPLHPWTFISTVNQFLENGNWPQGNGFKIFTTFFN